MTRISLILFFIAVFVTVNGQSNYSKAIELGDAAFKVGDYQKAINMYFAAEAFIPGKKDSVKIKVNLVFDKINSLKKEAEDNAKKAINSEKRAKEAQKRATEAQRIAETQAKETKIASLAAKVFLQIYLKEYTEALNLALAAYMDSPNEESRIALQFLGDNSISLYKDIYPGHQDKVKAKSLAFSPDTRSILTLNSDSTATLWSLDGKDTITFSGHQEEIKNHTHSTDKGAIQTDYKYGVTPRASDSKDAPPSSGQKGKVLSVAYSPDGQFILTGNSKGTAVLWSMDGKVVDTFHGHKGDVTRLAFSPDGQYILMGDKNSVTLQPWGCKDTTSYSHNFNGLSVAAFTADSNSILTCDSENVLLWSLGFKDTIQDFTDLFDSPSISSVAFSPDGLSILFVESDGKTTLTSLDSNRYLLATFSGHQDPISSVAFSPDSQYILTGSADNTVRLWSLEGQELQIFSGFESEFISVAFSPDNQSFLTATDQRTIKKWTMAGQELTSISGHKSVAFSCDSLSILTLSNDKMGTAKLWSTAGQKLTTFCDPEGPVSSAVFSPDCQFILTINDVTISDVTISDVPISDVTISDVPISDVPISDVPISDVPISDEHISDTTTTDTTISDKTLNSYVSAKLWSLDGTILKTFSSHGSNVISASFTDDNLSILTLSDGGVAMLWSLDDKDTITFSDPDPEFPIYKAIISPDGQSIITLHENLYGDRKAELWSLDGQDIATFLIPQAEVSILDFSFDSLFILDYFEGGDVVRISRSKEGKVLAVFSDLTYIRGDGAASDDTEYILNLLEDGTITFRSPNGQRLATFSIKDSNEIKVIFSPNRQSYLTDLTDLTDSTTTLRSLDGQFLAKFSGHKGMILCEVFSPDGQFILTGSDDHTARLWSLDGQLLTIFTGHTSYVERVTFSRDGQYIFTNSDDNTARIWSLDGTNISTFYADEEYGYFSTVLSTYGQYSLIASQSGEVTLVFDGNVKDTFPQEHMVTSGAFSPNGQHIVTGGMDKTARVWSLDGQVQDTLSGHEWEVTSVAFSPDGEYILTGSADNTARLWSFDGHLLTTFTGLDMPVSKVSFSPDGLYIVVSADDYYYSKTIVWHNIMGEWEKGVLWDRVYQLSKEEQLKYGIDWKY